MYVYIHTYVCTYTYMHIHIHICVYAYTVKKKLALFFILTYKKNPIKSGMIVHTYYSRTWEGKAGG